MAFKGILPTSIIKPNKCCMAWVVGTPTISSNQITQMYSNIKNKDETNEDLLITCMSYQKYIKKVSKKTVK